MEQRLSYWMDTASAPKFPKLGGDIYCDVAVVGAGLTGITTALLLAKSGADVAVIEASSVGSGTSGYTTAKITVQHGLKYQKLPESKKEAYARANDAGLKRIADFVAEYNIHCDFKRLPAYVYTRDENDIYLLEKELKEYEKLGINGHITDTAPLPFKATALAMENQAQFHPLKYLYALANEFVKLGGRIFEHTKVKDYQRKDSNIIHTESGDVSAKTVVFTTNYPLVDFPGLFFIKLHQERTYAVCTNANRVDVAGMYINIHEPVNSIRMHYSDVNRLLLVGHGHRTAKEDEDDTSYEHLKDFLRADFKAAAPEPSYMWSAQDCFTLDGMPYIGAIFSKNPNAYVATGFEKWGMTNSAAAAMMLSDYISGTSFIDHEVREKFDPIRFTPGASAKEFFSHMGTVLKALTLDNALIPAGSYDDVEAGKGAVLRVGGKAQAIYKDKEGNITAFKAHCTHMGCPLEYNEAENSFDCVCHGSRFSMNGEILDGPAKDPLEKIEEERG
ncbi:MAG: FAD-dependent oxidoreductase [Burkholderiales bacterium]